MAAGQPDDDGAAVDAGRRHVPVQLLTQLLQQRPADDVPPLFLGERPAEDVHRDTAQKAAANRSVALRRMVEQFSDKDKYEFMLLDSYGGVIASSSGTDAEGILSSVDFERAQENADGMGMAIYRTASNEMVMAVCCLVPYAAEDVAAMRLVTSLTLIQNQMKSVFLISIVVVVVILGFTVASGLYFVRSIVVPLGQVERTAASIARGELDVRLP